MNPMHPHPLSALARHACRGAATLLLAVASLAAPAAEPETGLVAHWRFSSDRQQGSVIKALRGGPDITPSGPWKMLKDPPPHRLELPGTSERVVVAEDASALPIPRQGLTLEAWVRIDRPQASGAIFGALAGSQSQPGGFELGFTNAHFHFALAAGTTPRLSSLTSPSPIEPGRWYHLAATYDGKEQRLYVNGRPENRSTDLSGPIAIQPKVPLLIGSRSTSGGVQPMQGAIHEIRVFGQALGADAIARRYQEQKGGFPEPAPAPLRLAISYGPFVDWISRTSALVSWETAEPLPSNLELAGPDGELRRFESTGPTRTHQLVLDRLRPNSEYFYRIHGPDAGPRKVQSPRYLFDTSFYYRPATPPAAAVARAGEDPFWSGWADAFLADSGMRRGWCVIAGAHDGGLALELVLRSDLKVLVIDPDPARIRAVRARLDQAGVYGVRASAQVVSDPNHLPFGDHLANLVLSEAALRSAEPPPYAAAELHRLLRPGGGVLRLRTAPQGKPEGDIPPATRTAWNTWRAACPDLASAALSPTAGPGPFSLQYERPALAGAGEWSHQYGSADNTSTSMDERVQGDLQVAWWGDPGPRPMPDRGPRNPSPVSVGGRLFIQGDRTLFGLDAYNGSILWNLSMPEIRRANLPRDCSNMAGSGDTLYLAHRHLCLAFEGATGGRRQRFPVPALPDNPTAPANWGYLAIVDGQLIGSRVKPDSQYLGDDGEWYEDFHPDQVARVTSEALFGLDPSSGATRWLYRGGVILNSTITIGDGMIFFIESRNPAAIQAPSARLTPEVLTDQHLVALDLRSGRRLWEKPQDFSQCEYMTYLVYSRNTVVVTGTDRNKNYHTFAFNAPAPKNPPGDVDPLTTGGQLLWSESHKEDKGHHSGHLQHPVVIDGVFYSDQRAFDLSSGKTLRKDLPERRGCGTMSAARNAIFFRHHFQAMWDLKTDKRTQFEGIRAGCWLSLIPAGGLLLAPETSAGCSCTHAIQTSVGYLPRSRPK